MKQLLVLLLFLCSIGASAQDVIVKKDGSTILCRIVEVGSSEIIYKRWSDLGGSNYVMNRTDASVINYESGKKENISEMTNDLYALNNQNDGTQYLNDQALLTIDATERNFVNRNKKARTLKAIGWIGGATLVTFGIILIAADDYEFFGFNSSDETSLGIGIVGLGAAWTTSFLLLSSHQKEKVKTLDVSAIWQYDFKLSGNSSLSAGIDIIRDRSIGENTLGLGLRYNF